MADFTVPYVCPECGEDRWVNVDGLPGGQEVECRECGHTGTLKGPGGR